MILLSGRFVDDLLYGLDWGVVWRKGGAILALLLPILLFAFAMIVGLPFFGQAFGGMSLSDLNDTSKWLLALLIGGGLFYVVRRLWRRLGQSMAWRVVLVSVLALGSLLTLRYAWMAAYNNYETAKEFLVYAHGTPDVKHTVKELQEMSRRLYGDEHSIKFAYSSDATWPFEWYFDTLFPNRVFFGREPTREATNVPVLVVGREEIAKTEPFLGNRYYRFDRKLVWWPHQDYYMGLSLAVPPEEERLPGKNYLFLDLRDPDKRRQLWNVLFYREYDQSLADWEPSHPFAFYVRKDIAAQLWDYGVVPTAVDLGEAEDPYAKGQRPLNPVSVWGGAGVEEGRFNNPRNVAVGSDGAVYVADGGNHRIQKFTSDGEFVTAWGHMCRMFEGQAGCVEADGAGGFYDPWGLAVDQDGYVYVADTWNHRVQKFTSDGAFVTMWGTHGVQEDAAGGEGLFWGAREIAIGSDGLIYVSDTGNKRIQVFTPDGQFLTQWGGKGLAEGRMDEPVGLAVAPDGRSYVADTWNQRIQVFDAQHFYSNMWEVDSWYGQSLENKPYLALDGEGRVYVTDPEGYRILVFDSNGRFLASLGKYGTEDDAFMLPTGIAIDSEGYLYVADTATHRVIKYAPGFLSALEE
jgi:DNA-binding beta-propeller fold protein YncE